MKPRRHFYVLIAPKALFVPECLLLYEMYPLLQGLYLHYALTPNGTTGFLRQGLHFR